eukprot:100758_1
MESITLNASLLLWQLGVPKEEIRSNCQDMLDNINHYMLAAKTKTISMIKNPSIMKNMKKIKHTFEQNGVPLRDYFIVAPDQQNREDMWIQRGLKFVAMQKYVYKKNSPKCIQMIFDHISNRAKCKIFNQLNYSQCLHDILGISSVKLALLLNKYIQSPSKYMLKHLRNTIFDDNVSFLKWMMRTFTDSLFVNAKYENLALFPNNYGICCDCLATFWCNSSYYQSFLKHSELFDIGKLFDSVPSILRNCFPVHVTKQQLQKLSDVRDDVFRIVMITDLWHKFLAHPQFMKHFLFNNINIFAVFIKYWSSMRTANYSYHLYVKVMVTKIFCPPKTNLSDKLYQAWLHYYEYILNEYVDISCIFYSMIRYMKQKHIMRENGMIGHLLNNIQTLIGTFNVENDYFQCVLNLIWKGLVKKYKKYNINIEQFMVKKLV